MTEARQSCSQLPRKMIGHTGIIAEESQDISQNSGLPSTDLQQCMVPGRLSQNNIGQDMPGEQKYFKKVVEALHKNAVYRHVPYHF